MASSRIKTAAATLPRPSRRRRKWVSVSDYVRTVDLEHMRTRVRQRQANDFVFAAAQNMKGHCVDAIADGDVAFNRQRPRSATRAPAAAARARAWNSSPILWCWSASHSIRRRDLETFARRRAWNSSM
jgi:hypothetical protein